MTPRQRAQYYTGHSNYGGVRTSPDDGLDLFGLNSVKSAPSIDAQGNPVLAVPRTGFMSSRSKRNAAELNLPIILEMMQGKLAKEMQGSEQSHDIAKTKLADALKNNDLKRALAATLNIPVESLDKVKDLLETGAIQDLTMKNEGRKGAQKAYDWGAKAKATGVDPNKLVENVPAGAIKPMPSVGLDYDIGYGSTQGPSELQTFIKKQGMTDPKSGIKLPDEMGAFARPTYLPGGIRSKVDPTIRAGALSLDPNQNQVPPTPSAITPTPDIFGGGNVQSLNDLFPALNNQVNPSVSNQIQPVPTSSSDPYSYRPLSLQQYQDILKKMIGRLQDSPTFLSAP